MPQNKTHADADDQQLSAEEAREVIKAIADVEREEAEEQERESQG